MPHRLPALMVVGLTIVGLLARPVTCSVYEHEHDGGADPHQHAELVGHVAPSDSHAHPHDDADEPSTGNTTSGDDGAPDRSPDDGDRHSHYQDARAAALRRSTLGGDSVARLADAAWSRLVPSYEQPAGTEALGLPPSPGDSRGHPQPRMVRTIDRLVRGLGLLI